MAAIIAHLRRLHFFELFTLANLALIAFIGRHTLPIVGSPLLWIVVFVIGMLPQAAAGIAVRVAIALYRRDRTYLRIIRSGEWIADTLRLIVATALMVFAYGWLKLTVPVLNPRRFDQELWDFDRLFFFGMSPNVFFLDVFSAGAFLRAVDWTYANVFYVSSFVAFGYFLSEPSGRVRVAFANGNAALWLIGAWLYLLVPSLGPVFGFPDLWFAHEIPLRHTQTLQAQLMSNYQSVLQAASGQTPKSPILLLFGIAAFPSLHVAFQTYIFLWMRRLWTAGQVLFAIFVFTIFLGSIITGWHYMIDGFAGIVLAWLCFYATWRASRLRRFLAIRHKA